MIIPGLDRHLVNLYLHSTKEGVFVLNDKKVITYCNSRYLDIIGCSRKAVKGETPTSILNGWHDEGFYERMWESLELNGKWEDEVWDTNQISGDLYVINQKIIKFKHKGTHGYLCILTDITTKLKTLQELEFLEKVDKRTNIANRFFGEQKLSAFLDEEEKNVAVIVLDINNFEIISETFGFIYGDSVLKEIALRIRESIHSDNLFSFDKDRFVIYFSYNNNDEIELKAFDIIDAFYEPFNIENNDFFLTVNLGISLYNIDGTQTEQLIKNADSAMNESRKEDFNTFSFYEAKMNESVLEQFQILSDLRKSMERNELSMVYQPQLNCYTGKIIGSEALIRWNNSQRGNIPPSNFIPLAESKGLITPIGEWVLRNSYKQFVQWEKNNIKGQALSINISGVQFKDKKLLPLIKNIFYNKVDTSLIELEITESAFVTDADQAIETMHKLKDMGFSLAIDDFGTGFSSLSYLKHFPIDKLKIDKSFVDNILTDSGDRAIVKTIISLADHLSLKIIAEGVESEDQKRLINKLGCPLIQGYLFSKPLTGKDFITFYNEKNNI